VRVIIEGAVELGKEYDVAVGDVEQGGTLTRGRIVWVQNEPDGVIAGVEFRGGSGEYGGVPGPEEPAPDDQGGGSKTK
jgi:hypothetical protein